MMTTGKARSTGLAGLIRNPVIIAALIFLLNLVIGQIIAAILNVLGVKNNAIVTFGGLISASIIGSVHAAIAKEYMFTRAKAIATVLYTLAGIASTLVVFVAAGLPISLLTLIITLALNIVYAVAVYFFIGLGEKLVLKSAQLKKSK